jgi:hypothetical protein
VHPGAHVDSDEPVPAEKRGAFDVVLQHNRRGCLAPGELPRLLAHYSALLGTDDFSVVTTVRHPVARFLSHFYFFAADELERASGGKPADLAALVHQRGYNNLTACVFGVQQLDEAIALVNSSLFRRVFFIPVEYLHEGVAMLSRRCGWGGAGGGGEGGGGEGGATAAAVEAALGGGGGGEGTPAIELSSASTTDGGAGLGGTDGAASSSTALATTTAAAAAFPPPASSPAIGSSSSNAAVFLNVNENSGDRGGHVRPSLRIDHFARNDPSLLRDMAEINSVDLFLYGAALAQFRERLEADAPSSLAVAAHLRAAQHRLGARCQGASRNWNIAPAMCSWLALYDTVYLNTVDPLTGLVNWESVTAGRPLSQLRRESERDMALLLPSARPFFAVAGAAVVSSSSSSAVWGGAASSSSSAKSGTSAAAAAAAAASSSSTDVVDASPEAVEGWSEALLRAGAQRVYLAHATAAAAAPVSAPPPLVLSPRTQQRVASGEVVVLELGAHGDGGGAFSASTAGGGGSAAAPATAAHAAAEAAAYAALTAAMRRAAFWGLVVGLDERVVLSPGVRSLPWALADAERESPLVAQTCAPVLLATERADAAALLGGGGGGSSSSAATLRPAAARLSRGVRCAARLANVRALRPRIHEPVNQGGRAQALCAPAPAFWGEGGRRGADEAGTLASSAAGSSSSSSSPSSHIANGGGGATTDAALARLGAYVDGVSPAASEGGASSSSVSASPAAADAADADAAASIARLYGPDANCVARPMSFSVVTVDALEPDAELVGAAALAVAAEAPGPIAGAATTLAGELVEAAAEAGDGEEEERLRRPSITRR